MPEDCVRIDPEIWAQIAGLLERREEIRATYQTFDGRISEYTLRPNHTLLAYTLPADGQGEGERGR